MLRVLIVDDEAPARKRLCKLLLSHVRDERLDIVGEAEDGIQALEKLTTESIDLLFLDIHMPEMDGFDVLERIPPDRHPVVVFTTAYDAYALRAFEANAIDYLLKPIAKERLDEAVARAERMRRTPETRQVSDERLARLLDWVEAQTTPETPPPANESEHYLEQISIPYRDRILIVPVERLVSAEINEGITRLFVLTEEGNGPRPRLRQHVVNYTLDQLETSLAPAAFMRVHRSAIVRLQSIREMIPWFSGRYKLVLEGEHEVIASRERSRMLKERLML
ncbi:MAG: LytR/AlgR family response regulator transcription factor [Rhodothermales bacterium]